MGTRGIINVLDSDDEILVSIYRQYDCYPSGLGEDIKKILNDGKVKIINGIGSDEDIPSHFNGMGCLAAYLIERLKESTIGNVYIYPPGSSEEYNYTLYNREGKLYMKIEDYENESIYDCLLKDFDSFGLSE